MTDQDFRIKKWSVPVSFHTARGEKVEGEIFLDMVSTESFSMKQVLDYFNSPSRFFPIKTRDHSRPILYSKDLLETVEVPGALERYQQETATALAQKREAVVHMDRLGPVRASVILELPADHSRLLDLLSLGHQFFAAIIHDSFCLLNSRHIYKIEEL